MGERYPRNSLADHLLSDKERTSAVHIAAITDENQECPGAFDIFCACGWYGSTLHGEEHAKELFGRHKAANGASPTVIPLLDTR